MSEYVTLDAVKEAYVNGEIGEAELEAQIERVLEERNRRHELVDAAFLVAVSGVVLDVLLELQDSDGGEN